ncbi:hypothetical protein [Streptomyces sp. NPDC050388]|uniref:hypothetical protein n=1 Tax=Streptomyces sp. NPDC050388 TaxID=3155781 RepID=UPI003421822E
MAHVWVLYDSSALMTEVFRADAIEHVRSTNETVDALRIGAEGRVTVLHVSGRPKLPPGFGLDLLKTIARASAEHLDEDTVVVPTLDGETWKWVVHPLLAYELPKR